MSNVVLVFAHRGASGYEMENTLKAYNRAKKLCADGVEIDIQLTKDLVPVVIHDLQLYRVTGIRKLVTECTLHELKKMKVGHHFLRLFFGHPILTLDEVIQWSIQNDMKLNIEMKESFLEHKEMVSSVVKSCEGLSNIHISSFHYELLELVKKADKNMETAYIHTRKMNWDQLDLLTAADAIHGHKRYYREDRLEACLKANKKCRYYSISGKESFLKNPHEAVVGWITDYPDKVINAMNE